MIRHLCRRFASPVSQTGVKPGEGGSGMGTRLSYEQAGSGRGVMVWSSLNDMVITGVSVSGWRALTMKRMVCALSVREDQVDGVAARTRGWETVR